jgi:hypothetical protein
MKSHVCTESGQDCRSLNGSSDARVTIVGADDRALPHFWSEKRGYPEPEDDSGDPPHPVAPRVQDHPRAP